MYTEVVKTFLFQSQKCKSSGKFICLTKACNELMALLFSPARNTLTGVRLFTVYGPWGRPDMAAFGFCERYWPPKRLKF